MSGNFFEDLYNQLSQKLTTEENIELLKLLLEWLKEGGGKAVKNNIKELVKTIKEE